MEVLGPEHEFSIVDEKLRALPIADKILKDLHGRVVNTVEKDRFSFGKELQLHVMEFRPNEPFKSPAEFEETMQNAMQYMHEFLQRKYHASLLGTGMHPLLNLDETQVWPHRHKQIYEALGRLFDLKRHGWLNIQSFQLNLPYSTEKEGVLLHNLLAYICAYLPAVAAASPVYEGKLGECIDNRLHFYKLNQKEVPSVTGDIVPGYVSSFEQYKQEVIGRYSLDMATAGADAAILGKEWVNSRGVIFRFGRRALEIRVMDEQECVKSDVALSCFVRALLRGLLHEVSEFPPHEILVKDFKAIVSDGLNAKVRHPHEQTARQMCKHFYHIARANATEEEKRYLPIVQKRIENGNLSEIIRKKVLRKSQRTDFKEAIVSVYSGLMKSLIDDRPYF